MPSSDPRYLLFAAFVALLLPFIPGGRPRLAALVLLSLLFYASFNPWYLLILAFVTLSTFGLALVFSASTERLRKPVFVLSIIIALLPLLSFKYLGGMLDERLSTQIWWLSLLNTALPVGLSFYTFQAVGYLIDVYVGNLAAERDAIRFSAFMSFFPQLLAGPIERAPHLLPQLSQLGQFEYARAVAGVRAILIGLFLKIVVADSLSPLVDSVYSDPRRFSSPDLALATIYFSFEVYADFAGYSLIAIGSARLLGIELLQNFTQPFLSQSLPEYWRTWHITLSSWFRDYVFTPLQFQWRRQRKSGPGAGPDHYIHDRRHLARIRLEICDLRPHAWAAGFLFHAHFPGERSRVAKIRRTDEPGCRLAGHRDVFRRHAHVRAVSRGRYRHCRLDLQTTVYRSHQGDKPSGSLAFGANCHRHRG